MTDSAAFPGRHAFAAWLPLLFFTFVTPGAAQMLPSPTPAGPGFVTRYDFHLTGAALGIDDPRFSWVAHFGGDLDLVDYVAGRASISADYEVFLGDEIRAFDPNQGNYMLEASSSLRVGSTEVVGVFHHVSRHLSDRPKRVAIAWNTAGARLLHRWAPAGATTVDLNVDAARVVQSSEVDYTWIWQVDVLVRRALTARVGAYVHASGQIFGVDPQGAGRARQTGGTAEAGVKLGGRAGAIELFAGYEKRVDAGPFDRRPLRWGMAGFRLVNR